MAPLPHAGFYGSDSLQYQQGRPLPAGTIVVVLDAGTDDPATLYADRDRSVFTGPAVVDTLGNFGFYAEAGDYDLQVNGGPAVRVVAAPDPRDTGAGGVDQGDVDDTVDAGIAAHIAATDPHGDRAHATGLVTTEAGTRAAADTALAGTVTAEAASRAAADTTLAGTVTAEAVTRAGADTALAGQITAEATTARNADNLTSGTVPEPRIPSSIARDAEVTAAVASEALARAAAIAAAPFDAAGAAAAAQAASQPVDSDLTAIAALTTTSFGRALLALADAPAGRTALGLGTAATTAATAYATAAQGVDTRTPTDGSVTTAKFATGAVDLNALAAAVAARLLPTGGADGQMVLRSGGAAAWATPEVAGPRTPSTRYHLPDFSATANVAQVIGVRWWIPVLLQRAQTWDRIGQEVTTGAAASTVRLALYADDGTGYPGALIVDGLTAATTANGATSSVTISQALPAGWVWLFAQFDGTPTVVCASASSAWGGVPAQIGHGASMGGSATVVRSGYSVAAAVAAAPASAPAGMTWSSSAPAISLRAA